MQEYLVAQQRLLHLAKEAALKNVTLLVDAEQTYFQGCIDNMVLNVQRLVNKNRAVVFSTFQCYRVDSKYRLNLDMKRAKNEGWMFGAKLVRGAYMVSERERSKMLNYQDPIQPTVEATHKNYDDCVAMIMDGMDYCSLMLASHNLTSIENCIKLMEARHLDAEKKNRIYFAQLYGMGEHLTLTLGANGYQAYKYVPYGPVLLVIPYLLRRSIENASFLGGAVQERQLLRCALKQRIRQNWPFFLGAGFSLGAILSLPF